MSFRLTIFVVVIAAIIVAISRHRLGAGEPWEANAVISERSATPDAGKALRSLDLKAAAVPQSKRWADDLVGFGNAQPGQWVVGRCASPCMSPSEAAQMARADAAQTVYLLIRQQVNAGAVDQQWLRKRVLADIQVGELQADCLIESFDRPYGTVWTESLLLDVSPKHIEPLVQRYRDELRARQARWATLGVFAGIAVTGTWIVCFLLDVITKGYFAMRLKLAAATITVAAIALLI
jgi:hypothetical protein